MWKLFMFILLSAGVLMYAGIGRNDSNRDRVEAQETPAMTAQAPHNLLVVWTSADPEVARNMVLMYTSNAKIRGWWEGGTIRLLIWGPSQKLLLENDGLQQSVKSIMDSGVEVLACRGCAENYGIVADLQALGIDVHYTGTDLTDMLKDRWAVITF